MKKTYFILFSLLIVILCGCSKDEEDVYSVNVKATSIEASETFALVVSPNVEGWTFKSDNDLIASVSSNGLIKANYVGETNITVINAKKGFTSNCKVTVTPKYLMYRDPCLDFGATKATVKAYEKRTFDSETSTTLFYLGENSTLEVVMYMFENSVFTGASTLVPIAYSSLLSEYCAERYLYLGTSDDIIMMISPDYKTAVGLTVYSTSYLMTIYIKNTTLTRSANTDLKSIDLKSLVLRVKSIRKNTCNKIVCD